MSIKERDYTPMLPFLRHYELADDVLDILTKPSLPTDPYRNARIAAIKYVRVRMGWFLADSKNFVDAVIQITENNCKVDLVLLAENFLPRDYDNATSK